MTVVRIVTFSYMVSFFHFPKGPKTNSKSLLWLYARPNRRYCLCWCRWRSRSCCYSYISVAVRIPDGRCFIPFGTTPDAVKDVGRWARSWLQKFPVSVRDVGRWVITLWKDKRTVVFDCFINSRRRRFVAWLQRLDCSVYFFLESCGGHRPRQPVVRRSTFLEGPIRSPSSRGTSAKCAGKVPFSDQSGRLRWSLFEWSFRRVGRWFHGLYQIHIKDRHRRVRPRAL